MPCMLVPTDCSEPSLAALRWEDPMDTLRGLGLLIST
jgi:hypothetical protein